MNPLNKIGISCVLASIGLVAWDTLDKQGAPIDLGGDLQVVVWRDLSTEHKLPPEQAAIFGSEDLKEYLDKVTPELKDGEHAYRIWPSDVNVDNSIPEWKSMKAAHKGPNPGLQIKKGRRQVYDDKLPSTVKGVKDKIGSYK